MAATADLIWQKLRARYPAAVVAYQVTETFNKADGALGPNHVWSREVFKTPNLVASVVSNQCKWLAVGSGDTEDIVVPSPNIPLADVTISLDVLEISRTGTDPYLIDVGVQSRFRLTGKDTTYNGYAVAVGKNNNLFPPTEAWHMWLFRMEEDGPGLPNATLLGADSAVLGDVVLPGTLTYTASGSDHSITFTHSGPGGPMTIDVTDSIHSHGSVNMGCGPTIPADGSITIRVDNYQATATQPETMAELLKRYRNDNGLQRWEDYVAHVAGASPSGNFADDENAFWQAFVP